MNSNLIFLISKFEGVDRVEDFRPIALANYQFKIITEVLPNKLAKIFYTMDWSFLLKVLETFGFHGQFRSWVSTILALEKLSLLLERLLISFLVKEGSARVIPYLLSCFALQRKFLDVASPN